MESRRIWKFELDIEDKQYVEMPKDPDIISAQFQGDRLCVWAMVEPENAKRRIQFRIYGTGHPLPDGFGTYVATVQQPGAPLVWHLFVIEP